jgi:hemoglobin
MKFDSVTDDHIVTLVDRFYDRIREDAELGPVFEDVVAGHWDKHLTTMYRFWSSVMLKTGTYHGSPMQAHMRIPGLRPDLFPRWLTLFEQTVTDMFEPEPASHFLERANRIAESLKLGLFFRPEAVTVSPSTQS